MSDPLLVALLVAVVVGYVAFHTGRWSAPRDPHPLRVLLDEEEPNAYSGPERENVAALENRLVKAGWRHVDHVRDPEHYDEAGRYLWWGS